MVSVKVTLMAIALLILCLQATNTSAYRGCCQKYMKGKLPFRVIQGYAVQSVGEMCPINAIIFQTKKGKTCTDPALDWVMDYVNRLRNKAQKVHIESAQAQK
ncbi:C-C motif chemokine 20a.3 [Mugil cephalus]|uniref:C-C motif chemokine 20a.3 n=1 Tax=Mugil cephalus TaxID=48193 RepID=UPI001FB5A33E|nr:C-C motif chemokine 20a.3 [Mugil cephalus]